MLVAVLVVGHSTAAFAQTPTATAEASDRDVARRLAKEAHQAYEAGEFERAEGLIRGAYALDPAPVLLYNLAEILDAKGDGQGARTTYRRYLELVPDEPARRRIERRIQVLENLDRPGQPPSDGEGAKPATAPPPSPKDVTTPAKDAPLPRVSAEPSYMPTQASAVESAPPRVLPWVVAGAGVIGLGAGGLLGFLAQDKEKQARETQDQISAQEQLSQGEDLATAANVLYISGGVLLAGGLAWAIFGGDEPEPSPVGVVVTTDSVVAVGRF